MDGSVYPKDNVFRRLYLKMLVLGSRCLWGKVNTELNALAAENFGKSGYTTNAASKSENIRKNRYPDCLPFDHNRVKIIKSRNNETGYINASFINFPIVDRKYIMAAEPPESEREQLWKMVYEQETPAIVRLSVHNKKEMVRPNYPEELDQTMTFENCQVKCTRLSRNEFFETRDLTVTVDCGFFPKPHKLIHYQVIKWSEKNRFPEEKSWMRFREQIIEDGGFKSFGKLYRIYLYVMSFFFTVPSYAPVIQCSAGFARCGAFIISDVMAAKIEKEVEDQYSIEDMLLQLRMQRQNVWQPTRMTKFIYQFVLYYLQKVNWPSMFDEGYLERYAKTINVSHVTVDHFVNPDSESFIDEMDRDAFIWSIPELKRQEEWEEEAIYDKEEHLFEPRYPKNASDKFKLACNKYLN